MGWDEMKQSGSLRGVRAVAGAVLGGGRQEGWAHTPRGARAGGPAVAAEEAAPSPARGCGGSQAALPPPSAPPA